MIKSFRNVATRRMFEQHNARSFPGLDLKLAVDRLNYLDAISSLADLPPLKSFGLHALRGERKGQWMISVNRRWRICFEFHGGHAHNVEVIDYHKG